MGNITAYRNVIWLVLAQACFLSFSLTFIAFSGLAGKTLAADPAWATLPLSLTLIMTALSTGFLSLAMQRFGRKPVFIVCACFGAFGAALSALAILTNAFLLFCVAALFVAPFQASAQYYRFAAGESVQPHQSARAISFVLLGGLGAALLTPFGSAWFSEQFAGYGFLGVFVFAGILAVMVLLPLAGYQASGYVKDKQAAELTAEKPNMDARPLGEIIRQPGFIVAVMNGALGYAMMVFVMTATPLAMEICGFGAQVSANVITAHAVAMFLPSLFTGLLIERFGVARILLVGQMMFAIAFLTALSGITLGQFSLALIALGLGWNFCFIGGTSLLTQMHRPSERGRVQGLNEMLVFGMSALSSLAAGAVLRFMGWEMVNQLAFIILAAAFIVTIWWMMRRQTVSLANS